MVDSAGGTIQYLKSSTDHSSSLAYHSWHGHGVRLVIKIHMCRYFFLIYWQILSLVFMFSHIFLFF